MQRLYLLYDAECGLCRKVKFWAEQQPAFVELSFLRAGTPETNHMFPELAVEGRPEELVAVSDEGGVYRGTGAYIMCLYALREYREWALKLASPALTPLARQAFSFLTKHRSRISDWLGWEGEKRLVSTLENVRLPGCAVRGTSEAGNCPFCKGPIQMFDAVSCPECGASHHRECWVTNRYRCSIFGCEAET